LKNLKIMHLEKIILWSVILVFAISAHAQYKTTENISSEHYESGELLRVTKEVTKLAKHTDLYESYKKKTLNILEYYKDSSLKSNTLSIYKTGTLGRPCNEIKYFKTEYREDGNKEKTEKRVCDRKRTVIKEYTPKGRMLNRTATRLKWWRYDQDKEKESKNPSK